MEGVTLDPATRRERIEGEGVVLRRACWQDLDLFHRALSDPRAMRYWSTLPHTNIAQSRDWLASMIDADPAESDDFVIEVGGQPIGKLGCWRLPEIGFLIHPDFAGRGHAGRALAAYLAYLGERGAERIIADVDPRNTASLALLGRAGFIETGREARTFLLGEEWCDSVYLERVLRPCGPPA